MNHTPKRDYRFPMVEEEDAEKGAPSPPALNPTTESKGEVFETTPCETCRYCKTLDGVCVNCGRPR